VSKQNKIILLGVLALVLLGVPIGILLSGKTGMGAKLAGLTDTAEAPEAAPKVADLPVPDLSYVRLQPMNVTVIRNGRPSYQVLYEIALEVPNVANKERIAVLMPRYQDAVMRTLHQNPDGGDGAIDPADLDRLKLALHKSADAILGQGLVSQVLIVRAMRIDR
jgi:flagellar basal body-associated protein FliL